MPRSTALFGIGSETQGGANRKLASTGESSTVQAAHAGQAARCCHGPALSGESHLHHHRCAEHAPGCGVRLALAGAATHEVHVAPTGTVSATPLTFPYLPLFLGVPVHTQYAALDGAGLVYTSNGLRLTAGLN